MARIIKSPRAKIDTWKIAETIKRDNVRAAIRFLEDLDKALSNLARFPGMGPARDELLPGLRSYPLKNYMIFYRRVDQGIEVVRVIHGAREIDEIFGE